MISEKYTTLYLSSSKKQLKKLADLILALSKKPESNILVENIFRLVHSMKGAAAAMSFKKTVEYLHHLEDIIEGVYNGSVKLNQNILDQLFLAVQVLERNFHSIAKISRQTSLEKEIANLSQSFKQSVKKPKESKLNLKQQKNIIDDLHIDSEISVSTEKLNILQNFCDNVLISAMRARHLAEKSGQSELLTAAVAADTAASGLRRELEKLRIVPLSEVFSSLPYLVHDMAREQNKKIEMVTVDNDLAIDKGILDEVVEILIQLLKNSVSHGIYVGQKNALIKLEAKIENDQLEVMVSDNGRGIDWSQILARAIKNKVISQAKSKKMSEAELTELIFLSGISSATQVTYSSGRGIGLSLVKERVRALDGVISVQTQAAKGTTFILRIPLPLSIFRAIVFQYGQYFIGVPLKQIEKIIHLETSENFSLKSTYTHNKNKYKVVDVFAKLNLGLVKSPAHYLALIKLQDKNYCWPLWGQFRERELVMKSTPHILKNIKFIKGVAVASDGRPIVIVELSNII